LSAHTLLKLNGLPVISLVMPNASCKVTTCNNCWEWNKKCNSQCRNESHGLIITPLIVQL